MSSMASLFEKTSSLEASLNNISLSSREANIPSCVSTTYGPQRVPGVGLELGMNKLSHEFLTQQTWVRSAGKTLRHVVGLYITPENYKTLFLSFDDELEARKFAGEVLRTLSLAPVYLAGEETLHILQEKWTGSIRPRVRAIAQPAPIIAQIRASCYFSTQWEIVKELSFLAVSQEILNFLFGYAIVRHELNLPSNICEGIEAVPDMYDALLEQSPQEDLDSATRGEVFAVSQSGANKALCLKQLVSRDIAQEIGQFNWDINRGSRSNVHIIEQLHNIVKIGRRPVSDDFFWISSAQRTQNLPKFLREAAGDPLRIVCDDSTHQNILKTSEGGVSALCVFLTHEFDGSMSVHVMGHRFAEAIVGQVTVKHVRLDKYSFLGGLPQDVLDCIIEIASLSSLPIQHPEHTSGDCPRCEITDVILAGSAGIYLSKSSGYYLNSK